MVVKAQATFALGFVQRAIDLAQSSPPSWQSALLCNLAIFVVGSPLLVSGLSLSGIGIAFLLGTLTWRAFGLSGFLLVATYFCHWNGGDKCENGSKGGLRDC
ncbi:protein VTE6, chloroplastic-like [Cornus florida]|uniref:protein VTE6, chloroplastic-like n=1 Tax=Cornus florida TaxID=4283 RepID=UPI00289D7C82|nr:protein VTE6, chloroplastic-like [Cornus florida]